MSKLMRGLILVLGLMWTGSAWAQGIVGPVNQILCNKIATFTGVATATQLVAPITSQRIVICGWHVTNSSSTAYTFTITYGTQTTTPCDTGAVTLIPALSLTQSAPSADHIDYAVGQTPISQQLCVTPNNTALTGLVYYAQF